MKLNTIITLMLLLGAVSCIDPFIKNYEFNANLVSIEGTLTDQDPFAVYVLTSRSVQRTMFEQPQRGAVVELIAGDGSKITLKERNPGEYLAPENFRGKVGVSYRLRVRLTDARIYESTNEKLAAAPPIQRIYSEFNRRGIVTTDGFVRASSTDVYLDTQDNPAEPNFYLWRTTLYEPQSVCATCFNGEWNPQQNDCVPYRLQIVPNPPIVTDYACATRCWQIIADEKLNIFSDVLTNGRPITKLMLRKVPFYENQGALLFVDQLALSPTLYKYFNLIRQQSETTGTLTDVAPSPPVGNFSNVNRPDEPVVGYFAAAGVAKASLWIERAVGGSTRVNLLGREPSFEPFDPNRTLPLFFKVPCIQSRSRTPIAPLGWRF